jgi:hypothetical protein
MGITVGGEKAWKTRTHGELFVSYQWVNDEPAMLIFPTRPIDQAGCFAIALSSAWKYADSTTGGPTEYLFEQADNAARVMGMFQTKDTLRKIATVIVDGLPDLVDMPPAPQAFTPLPKGEMKLKLDGQTVAHVGNE